MTVSIPVTWKSDARSIITTPRGWPTIWLAVTGVVTLGSLLAFWSLNSGPPTLPVLGQLPTFQLRERSGALVDNDSLRHRVWVAAFFFTRCPGPCLTMTKRMAALRRELPVEVHLVSISVDPQTDQPAVLSQYAERFGIVPGDVGWLFLTGEQSNIFRLAREGFHLAVDAPEHPVLGRTGCYPTVRLPAQHPLCLGGRFRSGARRV